MKIHPVGADMLLADRQTDRKADMTKLTVAFHNFAKTSNKKLRPSYTIPQMQYESQVRTLAVHSHVPITFAHLSLLNVEEVINQPTSTIS
jgi:hypothetical protein